MLWCLSGEQHFMSMSTAGTTLTEHIKTRWPGDKNRVWNRI